MKQKKALVPVSIGNRGAGLAVSAHVRKKVVGTECFPAAYRADSAGDVEFFADSVVPNGINGAQVAFVSGKSGDIGHPAIKVAGAHRVSDGFSLVHRLNAGLVVVIPSGPAHVQKELCEVEVATITRHSVEFHQPHFDNLVAGPNMEFFRPESVTKKVRLFGCDSQEVGFASSLVMRGGSFEEVASIV